MVAEPTPKDWISIIVLGVVWGGTFMVIAMALEGYGPLTVACARTTLGALSLLVLMRLTGRRWPSPAPGLWSAVIWIGLTSTAIPFVLLSWGINHVPSAFAGISMAAIPLFVLPLAHFFSDEKLIPRKAVGVVIGFAGALVLIGPGLTQLGQGAEPLAQLACVLAALSYAVSSVYTRRCPPMDPVTLSALTLLVGGVVLVPLMIAVEGLPTWEGTRPGLAIVFLGLFPTAIATLMRVQVVKSAGSVFMTLVNYQVPIWSMVFGALVLSEVLPARFFIALALILFGLVISQYKSLRATLAQALTRKKGA